MSQKSSIINFRCKHRHSALSHPKCYLDFLGGKSEVKLPKILIFDIETSPLQAFVFQKSVWKANIGSDQVISEWFMLCWSAKWLFDDEIMSDSLTGKEAVKENDSRIVKSLWKLLNEADIVIAHNGDSFDVPNMYTRFIINGLPPTRPFQTIDTKIIAKKQFGFTHNSLNGLARIFGFELKEDIDFETWKRCVDGDERALAKMQHYNNGDVNLLEKIYLKLRPWIRSHPNMGLYMLSDGAICPNCGSKDIHWVQDQYYYTQTSKFPIFTCGCGAYGRSRKSSLSTSERRNLVVGLAK